MARWRAVRKDHQVLYIPAHRAVILGSGWPAMFREHGRGTPFVVREFSARVRDVLGQRLGDNVFPAPRRLREGLRMRLDSALVHGGQVVVARRQTGEKELRLRHSDSSELGILEWTSGQREALPLIVGLYEALPSGRTSRAPTIEWIIVEEPELGLHPDAIMAVMLLLFELTRRGYRLVISTHSPLVLHLMWALNRLGREPESDREQKLRRIFEVSSGDLAEHFTARLLGARRAVYSLYTEPGAGASARDISTLDPLSDDGQEAAWGGHLDHTSRIADVLAGS
jgi:hypothetical protein